MKRKYIQRINKANAVTAFEHLRGYISYRRIQMNRKNSFNIIMFVEHATNRAKHIMHWRTKVFPAMSSKKD